MRTTLRRLLDVDQILIFALLAVTVNQLGHYLSTFAPPGYEFIGYLQAIGIDATIWRCAHWFKTYNGKKQRRYAGLGLAFFLVISAWFNAEYYMSLPNGIGFPRAVAMGAVLPLSVAVVSYLHGVKEGSAFATDRSEEKSVAKKETPAKGGSLVCEQCEREFSWPTTYKNQRGAQNALNAHTCRSNGTGAKFNENEEWERVTSHGESM